MKSALIALESLLLLTLRLALGGLFLYSAYQKLRMGNGPLPAGPQEFAFSIAAFKILPEHLIPLATFAIPWTEALAGLALVLGWWTRPAALVLSLLMAVFTGGVVSVIVRGIDAKCGCFGQYQLFCKGLVDWCKVGENSVILLVALLVLWRGGGVLAIDRLLNREPSGGGGESLEAQ